MPPDPGPQEHGFVPSHLGDATAAGIGPERETDFRVGTQLCGSGEAKTETRDTLITLYRMCPIFLLQVPRSLLMLSCPCPLSYRLLMQSISLSPGEQIQCLLIFLSQKYLVLTQTPFCIIFRLLAYRQFLLYWVLEAFILCFIFYSLSTLYNTGLVFSFMKCS